MAPYLDKKREMTPNLNFVLPIRAECLGVPGWRNRRRVRLLLGQVKARETLQQSN